MARVIIILRVTINDDNMYLSTWIPYFQVVTFYFVCQIKETFISIRNLCDWHMKIIL